MAERLFRVFAVNGSKLLVPVEFTYFLVSSVASLITFCVTKVSISFGFYMFSNLRIMEQFTKLASFETTEAQETQAKFVMHKRKLYTAYLLPLLVVMLFVDELGYKMIE